LALGLALAGCAALGQKPPARDPQTCLRLFNQYDRDDWSYPHRSIGINDDFPALPPPAVDRDARLLRNAGCLTRSADLDGMPALYSRLSPHVVTDSGPAIRPVAVHLGVVNSMGDEARTTQFFRGLGYRSRGEGAMNLGRRLYIGPIASQGALDEALAIAREAGFISPYPSKYTRF